MTSNSLSDDYRGVTRVIEILSMSFVTDRIYSIFILNNFYLLGVCFVGNP
jgi:hypothetical protein